MYEVLLCINHYKISIAKNDDEKTIDVHVYLSSDNMMHVFFSGTVTHMNTLCTDVLFYIYTAVLEMKLTAICLYVTLL